MIKSYHQLLKLFLIFIKDHSNFIKKETQAQAFSCKFSEIFKISFFTEHLWATASEIRNFDKAFLLSFYQRN